MCFSLCSFCSLYLLFGAIAGCQPCCLVRLRIANYLQFDVGAGCQLSAVWCHCGLSTIRCLVSLRVVNYPLFGVIAGCQLSAVWCHCGLPATGWQPAMAPNSERRRREDS